MSHVSAFFHSPAVQTVLSTLFGFLVRHYCPGFDAPAASPAKAADAPKP